MRHAMADVIDLAVAADRRQAEDAALQLARRLTEQIERDRQTAQRLRVYLQAVHERHAP